MNPLIQAASRTIAMAAPQGGEGGAAPPAWTSLVPLILLFVVFYFLLIRPQQKRQKEHESMIQSTGKGDQVVTAGGLVGVVTNVKESTFTVRIADGVKVEVTKSSITSRARTAGDGDGEG